MYFQQKSLKEQEQERVWKQHQAKNKETYSNKFNKNGNFDKFIINFNHISIFISCYSLYGRLFALRANHTY